MSACAECSDAKTCTKCSSDFLKIGEDNQCVCKGDTSEDPNLIVDRVGSCSCREGFWLTETGCKTCE